MEGQGVDNDRLPELKDDPGLAVLSQRADGFFIYATTAVRFISPPHSPCAVSEMRSHLQIMLNRELSISHADGHERLVDEWYERILGDAFRNSWDRATRLRTLHTIVYAESGILSDTCQAIGRGIYVGRHPRRMRLMTFFAH